MQTPTTGDCKHRPGHESVRSRRATPRKKSSRPSAESGGAESRNAASSWLRGRGSSECGARRRNRRPASASGPDLRDAASSRRNSLGRSARCQTKNRARSQRVRIGWCGAVSRSGRATSFGRVASQCSLRATELWGIQVFFRLEMTCRSAGVYRLLSARFIKRKRSGQDDRSVYEEIADPRPVSTAATFECRAASHLRVVCHLDLV